MLILDDLARSWASDQQLRSAALRWTWFEGAFATAMDARPGGDAPSFRANPDALARAFFQWAEAVDAHASHEELDRIDFLHFAAGLLLQCLLTVQPAALDGAGHPRASAAATGAAPWQQDTALAAFVLTLLQALRLQAGAPALVLAPAAESAAYWSGLRENTAQDAQAAIAFLDQLCGLEPVWQSPSLIESRPAMRRARAAARTGR